MNLKIGDNPKLLKKIITNKKSGMNWFFVLLIVTIVEVHVLIFDVCVSKWCYNCKNFAHKMFLNSFILVCQLMQFSDIATIQKY